MHVIVHLFSEFSDKEEQQLANMDESMENDDKTKAQEYTDDNKNWLKPKTRSGSKGGKALFDESDDDNEGVMDDDFTTATSGEKKKHDGVGLSKSQLIKNEYMSTRTANIAELQEN